jgi:hypothetical protein
MLLCTERVSIPDLREEYNEQAEAGDYIGTQVGKLEHTDQTQQSHSSSFSNPYIY